MLDEGIGACGLCQIDAGAGRTAEGYHVLQFGQLVMVGITRCKHDVGNVLLNLLVDIYLPHDFAGIEDLLGCCHGIHLRHFAPQVLSHDEFLLLYGGITDHYFQHESVELGFWQLIGAFLLYGILCGHHQEGRGQGKGLLPYRHLMFLHGFEQRALHLCWGAVDFVGQHKVGEHGAFLHLKRLVFLRVDHRTHHVGREQVGRELYAAVAGVDESGQCLDGQRLSQSRHTL